jgi:lysophospholipase L1-like esterase
LLSIPDYGATPFGAKWNGFIASELKIYNQCIEKMASEYDLIFVDVNAISKKAKYDTSLLAADLLHPSSKMYSLWVDQIIKAL